MLEYFNISFLIWGPSNLVMMTPPSDMVDMLSLDLFGLFKSLFRWSFKKQNIIRNVIPYSYWRLVELKQLSQHGMLW